MTYCLIIGPETPFLLRKVPLPTATSGNGSAAHLHCLNERKMSSHTAILAIVAQEPALVRWLHSHDPDRDMSTDLLKSSATYISKVPQCDSQDMSDAPVPPTASLIVPMYARNHYVLGQLYGPMSPNAMALNMLSHEGFGSPPLSICRRFVVDLSYPDALAFLEYEWLSDGKLCVSMHNVAINGHYTGESILLASPNRKHSDPVMKKEDLLGKSRAQHPTKVVMRVCINELSGCLMCDAKGSRQCTCPPSTQAVPKRDKSFAQPHNWETWLAAFTKSRSGAASMKVNFTVFTPSGNHDGSRLVTLQQECELGVEPTSPQGNQLLKMFFTSVDMLLSHPCTDDVVRAGEERRDRIALANELSEDENWTQPQVLVVQKEEDVTVQTSDDCTASGQPVESSAIDDSRCDTNGHISTASSVDSRLRNVGRPLKGVTTRSWSTQVEPETASDGGRSVGGDRDVSHVEGLREIQKSTSTAKRKGKQKQKLFACDCGKVFRHKGHYNEHRLCVHEKVREHQCAFANCQRCELISKMFPTISCMRCTEGRLLTSLPNSFAFVSVCDVQIH